MLTNLKLRLEEKEEKIKEQQEEIELIKRQDRIDILLADGFYLECGKSLKENVCENIKYYFQQDIKPEQIKHVRVVLARMEMMAIISHYGSNFLIQM